MGAKTKLWFERPDASLHNFHFRVCICGDYVDIRKNGEVEVAVDQAKALVKEYPQWFSFSKPEAAEEAEEKAAKPPAENKAVKPPKSNR